MNYLKENKNFLSKENLDFIENIIFKEKNFSWYYQDQATFTSDPSVTSNFFSHTVLQRLDKKDISEAINSKYYRETVDILKNFLNSIEVKVNFFTRIAYNLTFNNGEEKCDIHSDHAFDHNQVIIYLNDCLDKNSKTVVLDNNKQILKEIYPEKFKGICFGSNLHYHFFPKKGVRIVLVATFI
jgi:hypothetical protein